LMQPESWRAYQTSNNEWNGPIDSTSCVEWLSNGLNLADADTSRPVFIRMVDTEPIALAPDFLYAVDLGLDSNVENWGFDLDDESYCNDGFCHGTLVEVGIPPAPQDTIDQAFRTHFAAFHYEPVFGDLHELCFATENFEEQTLQEVVFKFIPNDAEITFYGAYLNLDWDQMGLTVDQEDVPMYQAGPADYYFDAWSWGMNSYLFRYQDESYPSDTTISFVEFTPLPNTDTVQMVTVQFSECCTYTLQPYTQLRAGNLLDNDSAFHNLQIINLASQLCVLLYVEFVFDPDDRFVHAGGPIDFQGSTSCFRFHTGSALEVASGHELLYGTRGDGMLALYGGAEILLQENARLVLNNHVKLFNHFWQQPARPVEVYLKNGSHLEFGKKAQLTNASEAQAVKLRVYMEGGTVDLSGLSPEERSHVELIFPAGNTNMRIRSNPVSETLSLWWPELEEGAVQLQIYNPEGRKLTEKELAVTPEMPFGMDVSGLNTGTYLVSVAQGEMKSTLRFMKE
jgi:hypothetical protein